MWKIDIKTSRRAKLISFYMVSVLVNVSYGQVLLYTIVNSCGSCQIGTHVYEIPKYVPFNVTCTTADVYGRNFQLRSEKKDWQVKENCIKTADNNVTSQWRCNGTSQSLENMQFICEANVILRNGAVFVNLQSTAEVKFTSCQQKEAASNQRCSQVNKCNEKCRCLPCSEPQDIQQCSGRFAAPSDGGITPFNLTLTPKRMVNNIKDDIHEINCSSSLLAGHLYWALFAKHGNLLDPWNTDPLPVPVNVTIIINQESTTLRISNRNESVRENEIHTIVCGTHLTAQAGIAYATFVEDEKDIVEGPEDPYVTSELPDVTTLESITVTRYSKTEITALKRSNRSHVSFSIGAVVLIIATILLFLTCLIAFLYVKFFSGKPPDQGKDQHHDAAITYDDITNEGDLVHNPAYQPFEVGAVDTSKSDNVIYSSIDDTINLDSSC